jgi:hypothetical protein
MTAAERAVIKAAQRYVADAVQRNAIKREVVYNGLFAAVHALTTERKRGT